jgi:hypothetical protein
MIALAYVGMLAFDAFIIAGTTYMVSEKAWSPWWFLLAVLIMAGNSPNLYTKKSGKDAA